MIVERRFWGSECCDSLLSISGRVTGKARLTTSKAAETATKLENNWMIEVAASLYQSIDCRSWPPPEATITTTKGENMLWRSAEQPNVQFLSRLLFYY
jgi:hypothetical protein